MEPWCHFTPIAIDGSDLSDKVQWCIEHDDMCQQIALNGRLHVAHMEAGVEKVKTALAALWRMPYHKAELPTI